MGKNGRKVYLWAAAFLLLALHCMGVGISAHAAPKTQKISLSCREMSIRAGRAASLEVVNAKPKGASKKVKWRSSDPNVATVAKNGRVTAKKPGRAIITATSKSGVKAKAACKVRVLKAAKDKKPTLSSDSVAVQDTDQSPDVRWEEDALPAGEENLPKEATQTEPGSSIVESGRWRGMDWRLDSSGKLTISGKYDASVAGGEQWINRQLPIRSVDIVATNVESTESWFYYCSQLESVDLRGFDAGGLRNMEHMFAGCDSLESVELGGLNLGNATNLSGMFSGCSSLKSVGLGGLNLGNATDLSYMFAGCSSLKSVGLGGLNLENATDLS